MRATQLLRRLLDDSGGAKETGFLLVMDGEGLEELPAEVRTSRGSYGVHRVGTELKLRHLLWQARGAPLIAVMPEALALRLQKAPDLLRRAWNQRVHALSVSDVLEVILGVRVVGAEASYLEELALEHLESLGRALGRRTLPTVVDRRLLRELLLDETVGEQVRTLSAAQLLAAWVKEPPRWSASVSHLVRESMPPLHTSPRPRLRPTTYSLRYAPTSARGLLPTMRRCSCGAAWTAASGTTRKRSSC